MGMSEVGNHTGTVLGTSLNKAGTGNVQACVQLQDEAGNTITAYLATSEAAWPYTEKKLIACGYNPADYDLDLSNLNDQPGPIDGMKDIPFEVVEEPWQGQMTRKVSWIGAPGAAERMDANDAKTFAADLRKRLLASRGPVTPAKRQKPAAGKPAPWGTPAA